MDSLASAFELVVLSITALSVVALLAFICSDAIIDHRILANTIARKEQFNISSDPQLPRRAARRRSKGERVAAAQAA